MTAPQPPAIRLVVGLIAAAWAVLIPGEAGRLMTTPLWPSRRDGAAAAHPATPWPVRSAA